MSDRTVSVLRTHDDRHIPVAGIYDLDSAHTSVEFVARHLMITKVRGRFGDVRGKITIGEEPELSHVEVEIDASSLSSGNDDRDTHLKSEDFFDVEHYPTISFRSTSVKALPDATWEVVGDERIGFSAATDINREDFGLTWNMALETGGVLVGKTARIELSVEAIAATHVAVT
ncbi:MAG: hypothetical protein QOI61_815 [Actinomycetota bacterium]